jgi:hypothetical protein
MKSRMHTHTHTHTIGYLNLFTLILSRQNLAFLKRKVQLGMVVHSYNLSYSGGKGRIELEANPSS